MSPRRSNAIPLIVTLAEPPLEIGSGYGTPDTLLII
jgi:hypothetical protein